MGKRYKIWFEVSIEEIDDNADTFTTLSAEDFREPENFATLAEAEARFSELLQ